MLHKPPFRMTQSISPKHVVVYADDDRDDIELVEEAFTHHAHNVELIAFSDGSQALSYLRGLTDGDPLPCLVIFDINMPVLNGKDALIRLRQMERYANMPAVLFTTSSLPTDKQFAERYKAGFITKPLGYEQMEMIAREFIDHCTQETQRKIRRLNG